MKRFRSVRTFVIGGTVLVIAAAFAAVGGATTAAGTPPSNTSPPTISGSAAQGSTVSASSGSWSGDTPMSFAYQWERCDSAGASCANISGANQQNYQLTGADVGHRDRAKVTAHNSAGTTSANSATTAVIVAASPPSNSAPPAISGTASVGSTLTTSNGTWTASTNIAYTYRWRRCATNGASCADISGATSKTYVVVNGDVGHTLRSLVTATNVGGSGQATSNPTATITATAPANTKPPVVTGTAKLGQTLATDTGTWTGATPITYAYVWDRCDSSGNNCAAISGATHSTYVLTSTDVGKGIVALVTATNSVGKSTVHSNTVGPVAAGTTTTTTTTTTTAPSGTTRLPNGEISVPASNVPDTDRLTITGVKFTPSRITGRQPVTVTFKIIENNKYDVAGALVYVLGLPYSWAKASPEAATAADGTVSITITPTSAAPKKGSLVLFVRARTPRGDLLAGSSSRRLVQVLMRP